RFFSSRNSGRLSQHSSSLSPLWLISARCGRKLATKDTKSTKEKDKTSCRNPFHFVNPADIVLGGIFRALAHLMVENAEEPSDEDPARWGNACLCSTSWRPTWLWSCTLDMCRSSSWGKS